MWRPWVTGMGRWVNHWTHSYLTDMPLACVLASDGDQPGLVNGSMSKYLAAVRLSVGC